MDIQFLITFFNRYIIAVLNKSSLKKIKYFLTFNIGIYRWNLILT